MTSRINYNTPLKSVRTIRALKIDQCDPQTIFVDDPARLSDADLMKEAGIAFVWENAPGRSKVEQETIVAGAAADLKPPPQQVLAPPPSSKVPTAEVPKSPPPAGTPPAGGGNARPHDLFADNHLPPPEASADIPSPTSRSKSSAVHQLPSKPSQGRALPPSVTVHQQQSGHKPPPPRPRRIVSVSGPQPGGHHYSAPLSRDGGYDQQSVHRSARKKGHESPVTKEHHHHSSLASTLHALTSDIGPAPPPHSGVDGGSSVSFSRDEGRETPHNNLNRGSQDYLTERLRQAPMQGVKDFYLSGRHTPAGTVPTTSAHPTRPNSCMPTRANSVSPSEAGSHSDDGDQTDAGDGFSNMNVNTKDLDARYQVSILDGEQHDASRHTDPHARDFIMERFLPAAKAMVTETTEASDRRSAQEAPSVSPTRGKGRPSLPGRSRFAFKDQFVEGDEGRDDVDQSDMLFKCKFPWQMGALRSSGPQLGAPPDSGSVEQSPSTSFGNRTDCSPSPSASLDNKKESSPRPSNEDQRNAARTHAGQSERSATTKGENTGNFEDRRLPPKSRSKSGPLLSGTQPSRVEESDYHDSNLTFSGKYEGESLRGRNDTTSKPFFSVPKDRISETATHGDCDTGYSSSGPPATRSPEMTYSGSLGTLLKSAQQQRRYTGKNSGAAIPVAAVTNVQEHIPPSSILNHHRYNPSHAAAAKSLAYGGTNPTAKQSYHGNRVHPDESNSYPKHLKVNLIKQQAAEQSGGSGRPIESLSDEICEVGCESVSGSKTLAIESCNLQGKLFTTNNCNLSQFISNDINGVGWPLGKAYVKTASSDSKDASFSSFSDHSLRSPVNQGTPIQQEQPSSEKYSPVSVLQPPLPKSPAESWLFKVRPPAPPSMGSNWQGPKPKKVLDYSLTDDSMDVKWEVLVKSENAQHRSKLSQEVQQKEPALEKLEILGSKAR